MCLYFCFYPQFCLLVPLKTNTSSIFCITSVTQMKVYMQTQNIRYELINFTHRWNNSSLSIVLTYCLLLSKLFRLDKHTYNTLKHFKSFFELPCRIPNRKLNSQHINWFEIKKIRECVWQKMESIKITSIETIYQVL